MDKTCRNNKACFKNDTNDIYEDNEYNDSIIIYPDCIWTFVQYLVIIFCEKAIFSLKQLKVTKWFASHNKSGTACMAMLQRHVWSRDNR